jgi:hypothetical protein
MKRTAIVTVSWVFTIALTAGIAYWMGRQEIRTMRSAPEQEIAKPLTQTTAQLSFPLDLEIAQPLTEPQRQVLLRAPAVSVIEGIMVAVSEPGKPLQRFPAQGKPEKPPRGKLDLPEKPKDPGPPLNNPFKDDKPSKGRDYVAYPCQQLDSSGKSVWGVCFKQKF